MAFNFTRRQWFTLFILGIGNFFNSICISLQAPFFPKEAELKGASPSEYGFVFGVYELVGFLVSPFFGQYMNQIGVKFLFNAGIFTASIAAMLFGTLNLIQGHTTFIVFAFLIRIIEAIGNTAYLTASFAIIAKEFPESMGTTFAALETFFGLGLFLGPLIGGILYQLDGFYLPFLTTGILLLICAVVTNLVLPRSFSSNISTSTRPTLWQVIKIPDIFVSSLGIVATSISIGFNSATLEPHLRSFNLTPIQLGGLFVINGGLYAIGAPLVGYMIDKFLNPKISGLIGCCLIVIGFSFIGPLGFLPFETTLWSVIVGLVLHGASVSFLWVSCYTDSIRTAIKSGLPNDIETFGLVSALFTSSLACGAFIGPSVGGILFDMVGYRKGTYFVIVSALIIATMYGLLLVHNRKKSKRLAGNMLLASKDKNGEQNLLIESKSNIRYGSTSASL